MSFDFRNPKMIEKMYEAFFGLEKESLRIDENGFLINTKHPFANNSNIDRDFCENQTEFITDVFKTPFEVCKCLKELHTYAHKILRKMKSGTEYFWCFSNPPCIKDESDIPVASYCGNLKGKEIYRKYLAEKYGKMKMLYSGVHFNFNFSDSLLYANFDENKYNSFAEYKNSIYLELAKKITQYSWLIVYLTAASPIADGSFLKNGAAGKSILTKYSSLRCSEIGYWNDFIPILDYKDLKSYVTGIQKYIESGMLKSLSELYYPVRLKPIGKNTLENILANGVNHIELRMIDLNPLSATGVVQKDIEFLHLLLIYLMSLKDDTFEQEQQITSISNSKKAALYDDENVYITINNKEIQIKVAAKQILNDMEDFFETYPKIYTSDVLSYQKSKIENPDNRYAKIIADKFGNDYVKSGIELAKNYSEILAKERD